MYKYIALVLLTSCVSKTQIKNGSEISIAVPDRAEIYDPSTGSSNTVLLKRKKSRYKIYTLINASCSSCVFKLEKWSDFQSKISGIHDVSIIPICFSHDNFELLKFAFENDKIKKIGLSLILDKEENGFKKMNMELVNKYGDFTVLTDSEDNVLLQGNPMEDERDKTKFLLRIEKGQ